MMGKLLKLGKLCHGLRHCSNGAVAHWLATVCSALALNGDCVLDRVLKFWLSNGSAWVQAMP